MSKWKDTTVDGTPVRIYDEDTGHENFPIFGAILPDSQKVWQQESWTASGKMYGDDDASVYDLVPNVEPKPWTAATVPVPFPILRHRFGEQMFTITAVSRNWVTFNGSDVSYTVLFDNYVYTTDGKNWKECGQ